MSTLLEEVNLMEIKITIDDIDDDIMNNMAALGHVLTHLLSDGSVETDAPVEGGQQDTELTDGIDLDDLPGKESKETVKPTKWPCNWCGRSFNKPAQLNKHLGFCKDNPNNVKASTTERVCRTCGTTNTPQWRSTTHPDGPQCNACSMKEKRAKRDFNPFKVKQPPKVIQRKREIKVVRPVKKPIYTKMESEELRQAVASYVSGNNGVIMEAEKLGSALMASLGKRYTFINEHLAERTLVSSIGLQFKYIEDALKQANRNDVTYILQHKDGNYSMMILNKSGNFDVDEIREMLN